MMFSEVKEEKVEMSNILLEDKLFRDFSAARIMLKEIEQSLTTIPELDMLWEWPEDIPSKIANYIIQ